MPAFESHYTDEQRDAMAHAFEDRKIRPAARIVALAAAGELEEGLEPFTATESGVRDQARYLRRRRAGRKTSKLADAEPNDANEIMRRRLINAADWMLSKVERQQTPRRKPNMLRMAEELRVIARMQREISSLPGPRDPRPVGIGQYDPAKGKKTTNAPTGRGAEILAALRSNGPASPVQDDENTHTHAETDPRAATANT